MIPPPAATMAAAPPPSQARPEESEAELLEELPKAASASARADAPYSSLASLS